MEIVDAPWIDWAVATVPLAGQPTSGDRHVVTPYPGGVLMAVIDGLGHGPDAANVSALAARTLECHADQPVVSLVKRCHEALRGTRGAVLSLASCTRRDHVMTWLGVGNVEGLLVHGSGALHGQKEALLLRAGIVGIQLPPLSAASVPFRPGDVLILATDGVCGEFGAGVIVTDATQKMADGILGQHRSATDDALVLVARYQGERGAAL